MSAYMAWFLGGGMQCSLVCSVDIELSKHVLATLKIMPGSIGWLPPWVAHLRNNEWGGEFLEAH